jgi:aminoglycoside phosphotransferase (APT) family kinase protein
MVARIQPSGREQYYRPDLFLQWRMMETAGKSGLPVPPVLWAEPNPDLLGAPFFVMGKMDGRVPPDLPSYHAVGWITELSPEERRRLSLNALETLAAIHGLDRRSFDFLDRPGRGRLGLDRLLAHTEDWFAWAARGLPNPVVEAGLRYLREHQPRDPEVRVTWGDCRIGNIMFADDVSVVAVLDWEQAALGPPELDLGWWLMMERFWSEGRGVEPLEGFPDKAETISLYEKMLGRAVDDLPYYEILAYVRFAIIAIRATDLNVQDGIIPQNTTMATNNPITQMLAGLLGMPIPELAPEFAAAIAAAAKEDSKGSASAERSR